MLSSLFHARTPSDAGSQESYTPGTANLGKPTPIVDCRRVRRPQDRLECLRLLREVSGGMLRKINKRGCSPRCGPGSSTPSLFAHGTRQLRQSRLLRVGRPTRDKDPHGRPRMQECGDSPLPSSRSILEANVSVSYFELLDWLSRSPDFQGCALEEASIDWRVVQLMPGSKSRIAMRPQ